MFLSTLVAVALARPFGQEGDGCLVKFTLGGKSSSVPGTCTSQKDCSRPDSIQRKGFCPGSGDSIRCCIEAQEGLKDEPFDASKLDTEDRDDHDSLSLDDDTPKRRRRDDDSLSLDDDDSMSLLSDDDTPRRRRRNNEDLLGGDDSSHNHEDRRAEWSVWRQFMCTINPWKDRERLDDQCKPLPGANRGEIAVWRKGLCKMNPWRDNDRFDKDCNFREEKYEYMKSKE
jgi:hypothetical protein